MRITLFLSFFTFTALFTSCAAVGSFSFSSAINGVSEINNVGNATSGFDFQLGDQTIGQVDIDLSAENTYARARDQAVSGLNANVGTITGDGESQSSLDIATQDTYARSRRDDAVAGIEIDGEDQDLVDAPFDFTFVADGNFARQRGARGDERDAIAGLDFEINDITNSELVTFNTTVRNNYARSASDDAEAGAEIIIQSVTNTSLFFVDEATNNVAKADNDAVAGIERNVFGTVSGDDVSIDIISNAQNNIAESEDDDAYAGIENDFDYIDGAKLNFDSYAKNNTARGEELVIAGVQNEFVGTIFNTNQDNVISSTAIDNFAKSEEDAIAGVKNDVDRIENSTIVFDSQATGNNAKEIAPGDNYDDGAIAGIENEVDNIYNSNVTFLDSSSNNRAVAQDSDAISGVLADIGNVYDSDITINANSSDNFAKAKGDGNAISGVYVDIYDMQNSNASIFASSNDNVARAVDGNAIAGNKVLVQNSDSDSTVSVFLEADGNVATSDNGEAVVDNVVNVNGGADVVYLP